MKTTNRMLAAVIAVAVTLGVLSLALGAAGPAFSAAKLSSLLPAAQSPGESIPMEPLTDLQSLTATVALDVNGKINGERTQGDLNALLATNGENSKVTVSGPLLGELAAQVGGSVVGLFTPSKVDLYKTPAGAYVVIGGLVPVCVKPKALNATDTLDDLNPQSLMTMLTNPEVARGTLVGEEQLNGRTVKHYVIDGDAFLAAAQQSSDKKLKKFGDSLWSAEDTDLFVDAETGHPVALRGNYSGEFVPLKFEGDFGVDIQLTGVNTNPKVALPAACNRPISQ
jgi:hypothetical protein